MPPRGPDAHGERRPLRASGRSCGPRRTTRGRGSGRGHGPRARRGSGARARGRAGWRRDVWPGPVRASPGPGVVAFGIGEPSYDLVTPARPLAASRGVGSVWPRREARSQFPPTSTTLNPSTVPHRFRRRTMRGMPATGPYGARNGGSRRRRAGRRDPARRWSRWRRTARDRHQCPPSAAPMSSRATTRAGSGAAPAEREARRVASFRSATAPRGPCRSGGVVAR